MIFSVNDIKTRIQMWAIRNLDPSILSKISDDEFIDILNTVARDFNIAGTIHLERYHKDTTAGTTNYEMAGVILEVFWFYYKDDDYATQHWSHISDTIVLEDTPSGETEMDIEYLRDIEDVLDDTDQIDLPEPLQMDYLELVRTKFKVEFAGAEDALYQLKLDEKAKNMGRKRHSRDTGGVWRHWATPDKDDTQYDITENWISNENLVSDADGDYFFVEYT